jgi:hypothetical protein
MSTTNFSDTIEEDLRWREAEIAHIKLLLKTSTKNSFAYKTYLRVAIAMLYAHFEGFVKYIWDCILDEIEKESPCIADCHNSLVTFSLCKEFHRIKHECKHIEILQCYQNYTNVSRQSISFPEKLGTQYNLKTEVFKEKISVFGIVCVQIDNNSSLIDSLVQKRHEVAHGKTIPMSSYEDTCWRRKKITLKIIIVTVMRRSL